MKNSLVSSALSSRIPQPGLFHLAMTTAFAGTRISRLWKYGILCAGLGFGMCAGSPALATSVASKGLQHPELVNRFYELNNQEPFWLLPGREEKRAALQQLFDSSRLLGLETIKYSGAAFLRKYVTGDFAGLNKEELLCADMIITAAAVSFFKDVYHGESMSKWISYDELSAKNGKEDDELLLKGLLQTTGAESLVAFATSLEPGSNEYAILKAELAHELNQDSSIKLRQLRTTLNYLRWLHHLHLHEFVLVNIGSATIMHFRNDTMNLRMKAIVGTPDTRTPRFATYCTEVVLYPYWNVPRSIAVNELFPKFKKSPGRMSFLNMELLDQKGNIVNPKTIRWKTLSASNFPYRFREKTGCVNPLGVVKFNITDPYSVYLHDTNFKGAFLAKSRYYSHGCIRVEEPVALANALLPEPLDKTFLEACYKELNPVVLKLHQPMPVLIVYMCAEVDALGKVQYFRDNYNLLK